MSRQAVREGRRLVIEDVDHAPFEILSALVPLIENHRLLIPGRQDIEAAPGFRLFATRNVAANGASSQQSEVSTFLRESWCTIVVDDLEDSELATIISARYPKFGDAVAQRLTSTYRSLNNELQSAAMYGRSSRNINPRDLLRWCARVSDRGMMRSERSGVLQRRRLGVIWEALDCFCLFTHPLKTRLALPSILRVNGILTRGSLSQTDSVQGRNP